MRYRVARLASAWTVVMTIPANSTSVTIPRPTGIGQYAVFTEFASGEATMSPLFYLSK